MSHPTQTTTADAASGGEGDWAYEIAKDIRVKWMQSAFVSGGDFALPAGHLSDIAEALRQAQSVGYILGHEAGEKAVRAALTTGAAR